MHVGYMTFGRKPFIQNNFAIIEPAAVILLYVGQTVGQ